MTAVKKLLTRAAGLARHQVVKSSSLRVISLVVGLMASVATARFGGAEVKGVSSAYAATVTLSALFWNFDLAQQALRSGREQKRLDSVLPWLKRAWFIYFLIALGLATIGLLADLGGVWLTVGTFASLLGTQAAIAATGLRGPTIVAVGGVLQQAALLVTIVALYLLSALNTDTVRLAVVLSYVAPVPLFLRAGARRRPGWGVEYRLRESVIRMAAKGAPWQAVRAMQTLLIKLDLPVVFAVAGSSIAGVYSVGVSTAMLVNIVPQQMSSNALFRLLNDQRVRPGRAAIGAIAIGSLIAGVLASIAGWLIPLMYGGEFVGAVQILYWALPGACAYGAVQVQSNYIRISGKKRDMLIVNSAGLIVMAGLLCFAVPRFGGVGGAVSFSGGLLAAASAGYFVCRRLESTYATDAEN